MSWLSKFKYVFERDRSGNVWYQIGGGNTNWDLGDKLDCLLTNPVTFRCVDLISDLASQAIFSIGEQDNHPLIERINNPNPFQSKQDLLREFFFFKYSYGWVYQYDVVPDGFDYKNMSAIYNLNPSKVEFNKDFATRLIFEDESVKDIKEKQFKYTESEQEKTFNIEDIIPFFDVANGLSDDFLLKSPSRLDSIAKNIKNINIALAAEKNALKTAGRWVVSGSSKGTAISRSLDPIDKKNVEDTFGSYGGNSSKGNIAVTTSMLEATSLHVPMSQLGIPESVAANSMPIMNAFGIPRELYTLDKTGATDENQATAQVNLIQNVVQPQLDDYCNTLTSRYNLPEPLTASLEHLPAMQMIEDKKADKALKVSTAIKNLTGTTIDPEEFLEAMGINLDEDGK